MTPEELAQRFHETYERLAPEFGYKTREASAVPWAEVPAQNKALMIAVCARILPSTPVAAQGQETTPEKEYEFDRYRDGKLMAEGARVRAKSLSEAISKAKALFTRSAEWRERDSLRVAASQPTTDKK